MTEFPTAQAIGNSDFRGERRDAYNHFREIRKGTKLDHIMQNQHKVVDFHA
jgi:hypothetical protein